MIVTSLLSFLGGNEIYIKRGVIWEARNQIVQIGIVMMHRNRMIAGQIQTLENFMSRIVEMNLPVNWTWTVMQGIFFFFLSFLFFF